MSFYTDVKGELIALRVEDAPSKRAELIGLVYAIGSLHVAAGQQTLALRSEHAGVLRRALREFKSLYDLHSHLHIVQKQRLHKNNSYRLRLEGEQIQEFVRSLDWLMGFDAQRLGITDAATRRALMRGSFLGTGWLSDPNRGYHMEVALASEAFAQGLQGAMCLEGLNARVTQRKAVNIVYLKGAEDIALALGMMGCVSAMFNFENVRAFKQVRGNVNRAMNCEAANLTKSLDAAFVQLDSIRYIQKTVGLDKLSENLRVVAEARLNNPSATLSELTELLSPLGRSGVNHRLRRLQEYAQDLRMREGAPD